MIIKKLKENKRACPAKRERSEGFVLLFAVTLSAILLAIALGISNIALREIQFGTSAKDTNDAFFAADTGTECAQFYDRSYDTTGVIPNTTNIFENDVTFVGSMTCVGISPEAFTYYPPNMWSFSISGLNGGQGCAIITVEKTLDVNGKPVATTITSNGYNNGGGSSTCAPGSNAVERQIQITY